MFHLATPSGAWVRGQSLMSAWMEVFETMPAVLAVGGEALEFWGALREVLPETREQRCWFLPRGPARADPR